MPPNTTNALITVAITEHRTFNGDSLLTNIVRASGTHTVRTAVRFTVLRSQHAPYCVCRSSTSPVASGKSAGSSSVMLNIPRDNTLTPLSVYLSCTKRMRLSCIVIFLQHSQTITSSVEYNDDDVLAPFARAQQHLHFRAPSSSVCAPRTHVPQLAGHCYAR